MRMRCFRPGACMPTSSIARSARSKRFSPLRCAYASRGCMMCPTPRCDKTVDCCSDSWNLHNTAHLLPLPRTNAAASPMCGRWCAASKRPSGYPAAFTTLVRQPSLHLRYRARSCAFPCRCRAPRSRSTGACLCRRTTGTQLVHEFEAHRAVWTHLPRHDYRTEDSAPPRRISRNEAPTCESQPCTAYAERKIPALHRGAPIRAGRAP